MPLVGGKFGKPPFSKTLHAYPVVSYFEACEAGDMAVVKEYAAVLYDARGPDGKTALHHAVLAPTEEVAIFLIDMLTRHLRAVDLHPPDRSKPELSWTPAEDLIIMSTVSDMGLVLTSNTISKEDMQSLLLRTDWASA